MDHWKYPLSSADSSVIEKSLEGARVSLHNAHLWGADTVLIVPGVVNESTSYQAAYKKSQESLRKLIPLAEQLKVVIAVDEVWNKFLLSPLEFVSYVDSFQTPWVRAYFDVGNVVLYGYPQDWIRTLGHRIAKLHIKDFSFRRGAGGQDSVAKWVNLGEGDINWRRLTRPCTISATKARRLRTSCGRWCLFERCVPAVESHTRWNNAEWV